MVECITVDAEDTATVRGEFRTTVRVSYVSLKQHCDITSVVVIGSFSSNIKSAGKKYTQISH